MAGVPYYSIVACCNSSGTALSFFNFAPGESVLDGTYSYSGPTVTINGITFTEGYCYTITGEGSVFTTYPVAPTETSFSNVENCNDIKCNCNPLEQCYTLYPCTEGLPILVSNSSTLAPVVGTFASLIGYEGCYFVVENELGDCTNAQPIRLNGEVPCTCTLRCWIVTGNPTTVTYVNSSNELVTTIGSGQFCSLIPPVVSGGIQGDIYNMGLCVNNVCPEFCFLLTSCTDPEVTITVSSSTAILQAYAANQTVKVNGYDECWTIEMSNDCDCAIDVSVLQTYSGCDTCLPIIAYKFINCNNSAIVKYSQNDFSAYVGKSVQLDCGDCWLVEQIDYIPPSTSVINILFTFDSCTACNRTYYKLTDCINLSNVIYTYTDLSTYLGKIIKVENCDSCFEIEETRLPINPGIITVTESFADCIECGAVAPCICTTIKNYDTVDKTYRYIDCEGVLQTITLKPGQKSDKTCMRNFVGDDLCNCIELTIDGNLVTAVLQPNKINGKPTWVFQYNSVTFNIVYDTNEGWQILTDGTQNLLIAELNNPMLNCPSGPWTVLENIALNVAVYLDNGVLVFQGDLIYDTNESAYVGNISNGTTTYQAILDVVYITPCNGVWTLAYYNTNLPDPVYETIISWPADCTCLTGTYTNTTPDIAYVEVKSMCSINTVDCSQGYAPFIPSATDDIEQYGDCILTGNTCYTYFIQIPGGPLSVETLYYKDCKGKEVQVSVQISKFSYEYIICGVDGQSSNDIYITGPTPVIFTKGQICNEPIYTCPPPVYPKPFIRPGYFVPSCDPEKYEKYACKSSEILYKTVLEKRYGISNCCPDTDLGEKWIVKKELADLQGALDPNYICTPTTSCCNNTPTCGCGCNSASKSCKSQ